MKKTKVISVFEHQRLKVGESGFKQEHLDALLKLNEFHEGNYFEPISKGIKFNQYVGVIQVNGLTIEINPKADKGDDDNRWKGVLLKMLKASGKLKASSAGGANVKRQHLNLLEVYFELYLNELENLVHKGLIKQYRFDTKNTKALKGKLEFAGHIQKNIIHKERFYTRHQLYDTDHLIHQILQNGLSIVDQFTKGSRIYDKVKRVQLNFPEVSIINITEKKLNSVKHNRKTDPYSYALELARLIILNYSPDIATGKEKMLSLLFNMNDLWERYILKELKKFCDGTDIEVIGQATKPLWNNNSLRPDIVLKNGSDTFVIDTKWKRPLSKSASISDLRQMYTYARFWNANKVVLLYPGENCKNGFSQFQTEDFSLIEESVVGMKHQCKMSFISPFSDGGGLNKNLARDVLQTLEL